MPRLRLAVAVLSALLAAGVADDVLAKPDGKSSLSSGFSSRSSSAPARERDTSRRGSDRGARSGKSDDSRDTAADVRPARGSRFGTFGNTGRETTAPSSPVSRRLTERTAQSNALRTLDARQAARRTGRVPPAAAENDVPPSRRSAVATAVPPSMRQGALRNGAASVAPALPPLRGGPRVVSGTRSTERTRHAVAAGAAAVGAGAALMATSDAAAEGTPARIHSSTPAAGQVPMDNAASAAVTDEAAWPYVLAFLAVVLGLVALAGSIAHQIWRWLRPRRPAPSDPRYSYERDWFGPRPGARK